MRMRVRRFLTDPYAYNSAPNYAVELVAFGLIIVTASWPILLTVSALTGVPK